MADALRQLASERLEALRRPRFTIARVFPYPERADYLRYGRSSRSVVELE